VTGIVVEEQRWGQQRGNPVAGVAAAAGVLVGAGQARHRVATQLTCGDTITTDARLTRDLNNCAADGIIIGARGVTLDLDGYTIDGVGAGIVSTTSADTTT
jgi:hypothetical protein